MSREDLTQDPGLDPDTLERSRRLQRDAVYDLPVYVEVFMRKTKAALPRGWRCLPWTLNRCVTVRNSRNDVMRTYSYEAIEDGAVFKMDDVIQDT